MEQQQFPAAFDALEQGFDIARGGVRGGAAFPWVRDLPLRAFLRQMPPLPIMAYTSAPKIAAMSLALPHAIACFFAASNAGDAAVLLPYPADDAVVHDKRRQHRGGAAIAACLAQTQATTLYRSVPLGVHTHGEQVSVTAQVSGNFPQSPLQLEHVFQLVGDTLAALQIH